MSPWLWGISWLQKHNPLIDWATGSIVDWSPFCHAHCFRSALPAPGRLPACLRKATDLSAIHAEYLDLREVFNKARATSPPPHRPYDCAIDLLPGTTQPRGRLYSLSGPETKTMDGYIENSMAAGFIPPSCCLAAILVWSIEILVRKAQCSQPFNRARLTSCLSQILPGPQSWNGLIPLILSAITTPDGSWFSSDNGFGGPPYFLCHDFYRG